jgi:formylglycine-generating enzyme required for sulfatase activity
MRIAELLILIVACSRCSAVEPGPAPPPPAETAAGSATWRGTHPGALRRDNQLQMELVWCPPGGVTMERELIDSDVVENDDSFKKDPPPNSREKPVAPAYESTALDDDDVDDVDSTSIPGNQDGVVFLWTETDLILVSSTTRKVKTFLKQGYWIGKYEVTQAQWKRLMNTEPWAAQEEVEEADHCPATYVDWNDATDFCRKLTASERAAGRLPPDWEYALPTEAQWERACRARTETRFSYGDDETQYDDYMWCMQNTSGRNQSYAHLVGKKKPNAWGIHDMHGNAWEWCRDHFQEELPGGIDPLVEVATGERVMRGGGFYRIPEECRSSFRHHREHTWKLNDLGFRVVLTPCRSR